jgi:hypothetical protein
MEECSINITNVPTSVQAKAAAAALILHVHLQAHTMHAATVETIRWVNRGQM